MTTAKGFSKRDKKIHTPQKNVEAAPVEEVLHDFYKITDRKLFNRYRTICTPDLPIYPELGTPITNKLVATWFCMAIDWEAENFAEQGLQNCDRYNDKTPRIIECDTYHHCVNFHKGERILLIMATIYDDTKYRHFLENKPEKLPDCSGMKMFPFRVVSR